MNEEDQKVALTVQQAIPQIEVLVNSIVEQMKRGGRIFYIGAGSSGRLGVLDASEIPPTFGMPSSLVVGLIAGGEKALRHPVENAEDDEEKGWLELQSYKINQTDTLIGIAASGTTPYVIGALRSARANGILTASVSCNPDSPVAREAEINIEVIAGPEFVTGSTRLKSGTAEKLVLNMISTVTMGERQQNGQYETLQCQISGPRYANNHGRNQAGIRASKKYPAALRFGKESPGGISSLMSALFVIDTDCIKFTGLQAFQATGTFSCIVDKYLFIDQGVGYK
jgi:N-acetylmuramic acid 6-phosphate etherase